MIDRHALWYKLIKAGIVGKIQKIIRSMYDNVKFCEKHFGKLSDVFNSEFDLFQGEVSSPMLLSLFINDIEVQLEANTNAGITLDQISIFLLLFADDAV